MTIVYVFSAAVVNFILGGIWYAAFGKQWMSAWGLEKDQLNKFDPIPYLVAFIGSLWASYGIFLIIKHIQPKDLTELMTIALGLWLFIFVGMGSKHYAFAQRSLKAFCIDYGLDLIGFIVMTLILSNIQI